MIPRPWAMSGGDVLSAEKGVRELLEGDLVRLLDPRLRPEHAPLLEVIGDLPWQTRPLDIVAAEALQVLTDATRPSCAIDPADDDGDVPWALTLRRLASDPVIGSRSARRWFAHGERLLWTDVEVSALVLATAAYYVACFEDALKHDHEVWRWMMTAAIQTEVDNRAGLGLVAVIRAAKLLTGGAT